MAPILESGKLIGNRYKVLDPLKHYKELFRCEDIKTNTELIIKVEVIEEQLKIRHSIENEWKLYKSLSTTKCFDFVVDYLSDDYFRYLVMRPLGPNLFEFWKQKLNTNEWNLEIVVRFADEMISRVANCHIRGIIHRDIKPENFVVDKNDEKFLYLIDFNLAKVFSSATVPHIRYQIRSPKYSVGNVQFLSVNAHKGEEQSRRDDLISIAYTLIYLAKGSLPWSKVHSKAYNSREKYLEAVGETKLKCSVDELCVGLPIQFKEFINYCLELKFTEVPNYSRLRQLFSDLLVQMKNSSVTLVEYKELERIPMKSRRNLSEIFKECIKTSPPMICR